jgi:hypothetical protein
MITLVPSLARLHGALLACTVARCTGPAAVREGRGCLGCAGAGTTLEQDASCGGCGEQGYPGGVDQCGVVQAEMRGRNAGDQGWEAER